MNKLERMESRLHNLKQIRPKSLTQEEKGEIRRLKCSIGAWKECPPILVGSIQWLEMQYNK